MSFQTQKRGLHGSRGSGAVLTAPCRVGGPTRALLVEQQVLCLEWWVLGDGPVCSAAEPAHWQVWGLVWGPWSIERPLSIHLPGEAGLREPTREPWGLL